jgi:hypothetical protein
MSRMVGRVVLGLLLVYLLIAFAVGLRATALRLRAAARTAGLSAGEMRARVFGPQYVAAVDQIRRTIPVDEPYLLDEMDEPGAMLWVRFDLLPRRAIRHIRQPLEGSAPDCLREQVRWLIVAAGVGRPPLLLERATRVPPGCPPAPWRKPAR